MRASALEARLARLEGAATAGDKITVRPLSDAPAHLRQAHSFVQSLGGGRVIIWADEADMRV
jgi:hypothetical protein